MRTRYGKFFADWRDAYGIRHAKAARRHSLAMKKLAAAQRRRLAKAAANNTTVIHLLRGARYELTFTGDALVLRPYEHKPWYPTLDTMPK